MNEQLDTEIQLGKWMGLIKIVALLLVLGAVGAGVSYFYQSKQEQREEAAFDLLHQVDVVEERATKEAQVMTLTAVQVMKSWSPDKQKEYTEALRTVIAKEPKSVAASIAALRLGRWYSQTERFDEAAQVYKDLLARIPNHERQELYRAMAAESYGAVLENQEKWKDALDVYGREVSRQEGLLKPLFLLGQGRVQRKLGQVEQAQSTYQALIKNFPNSDYEKKARALMEKGI